MHCADTYRDSHDCMECDQSDHAHLSESHCWVHCIDCRDNCDYPSDLSRCSDCGDPIFDGEDMNWNGECSSCAATCSECYKMLAEDEDGHCKDCTPEEDESEEEEEEEERSEATLNPSANPTRNPKTKICWICGKKPRAEDRYLCTCEECPPLWHHDHTLSWNHWHECTETGCSSCDSIAASKPWLLEEAENG